MPQKKLATDKIHQAVLGLLEKAALPPQADVLDIGPSAGRLLTAMHAHWPKWHLHGCDYYLDRCEFKEVEIRRVDLDADQLPYADASFDAVTLTEVIEHVESPRRLLREIARVLKPGGIVVLSTPNVLNVKSRVRYLGTGFYNLFGPLPMDRTDVFSTGAHITPISYFYIAHGLHESGFEAIDFTIDKEQNHSRYLYAVWAPVMRFLASTNYHWERNRYRTITPGNWPFVRAMNTRAMLFGRTVIVHARKRPAGIASDAALAQAGGQELREASYKG